MNKSSAMFELALTRSTDYRRGSDQDRLHGQDSEGK